MSKIQVDEIVNKLDTGAPSFPKGISVTGIVTATSFSSDGISVTGVVTATSFSGDGSNLTGIDATSLKDSGGTVRVQANTSGAVVTGILTSTSISVGSITASDASFSGNVSIAGTLTYEDVTNIDSIGIITARSGIQVLAGGINAVGVVTATSFEGDGSGLTGVDAGISAGKAVALSSFLN